MKSVSALALTLALGATSTLAQETEKYVGVPTPLFTSHEPVEFTLKADYDELDGDRSQDPESRDAIMEWD